MVAPSDSEYILAFDASTGQPLWETRLPADVVHLLGVGAGNLLASGDHLWWIDVESGRVVAKWPEQSPRGYGRGILAGDKVFWPTRDELYVFEQHVEQPGQAPLTRDPIPLASEQRQSGGGNLLISHGLLMIATNKQLFAYGQLAGRSRAAADQQRSRRSAAEPAPKPRP